MSQTKLTIQGRDFLINGEKTYKGSKCEGLLFNARFVQAVFDDKGHRERYDRFGKTFDPERNTDDLITALPEWYDMGLRAITVGLQGGGPCYTVENREICNSPFSEDGKSIDHEYLARLLRVLDKADQIGMAVIVSVFYEGQLRWLRDDEAVVNALTLTCNILRDKGYTNLIIEPCNEHNLKTPQDIVSSEGGMACLIGIAREQSGGMLCGCSGTGGYLGIESAMASDVVLIHGNGCTRNKLNQLISRARALKSDSPIVVNEDSQDLLNMGVCIDNHVSWGYYNNMTKQEPPCDWSITRGEDEYFMKRVAEAIGLVDQVADNEYTLMGMERDMHYPLTEYGTMVRRVGNFAPEVQLTIGQEMRFIRLASRYPERVDYVDFFVADKFVERVYDSPFTIHSMSNWSQGPVMNLVGDEDVYCIVKERSGKEVRVEAER